MSRHKHICNCYRFPIVKKKKNAKYIVYMLLSERFRNSKFFISIDNRASLKTLYLSLK